MLLQISTFKYTVNKVLSFPLRLIIRRDLTHRQYDYFIVASLVYVFDDYSTSAFRKFKLKSEVGHTF